MSFWDFFQKKNAVKRPLRDRKGRPYYLTAIPWHRRHPKLFVIGGGMIAVSFVFSAPIYHFLFTKPEDIPYQGDWWKHEIDRGIRDVDVLRAKAAAAGPDATLKQVFEAKPDFEKMPPRF